jgi:hypothetical protein
MNIVIIPTCNEYRIRKFDEYFNIYDVDHNHRFIFVADDRHKISREEYKTIFASLKNQSLYELHFASDLLSSVKLIFTDCLYFDNIVNNYPLSIKLLIFIWAKMVLGINKSMLLDDDVLFLKPIDHIFDSYDYVKKPDALSWLCTKSKQCLQDTYEEFDLTKFENDKQKINSGSIIYTWQDSHDLLGWVKQAFSSKALNKFVMERVYLHSIGKGFVNKGTGWGRSWIMEQYIYGMFMHSIGWDGWHNFTASEVNTGVTAPKDDKIRKIAKLPHIVHFLPPDKVPIYENYIKRIEQFLNK